MIKFDRIDYGELHVRLDPIYRQKSIEHEVSFCDISKILHPCTIMCTLYTQFLLCFLRTFVAFKEIGVDPNRKCDIKACAETLDLHEGAAFQGSHLKTSPI